MGNRLREVDYRPGFTRREASVLNLLLEGFPNREIASQLGISDSTTRIYVSRLLEKTGTTSRFELFKKLRNGEVEPAPTYFIPLPDKIRCLFPSLPNDALRVVAEVEDGLNMLWTIQSVVKVKEKRQDAGTAADRPGPPNGRTRHGVGPDEG